MLADVPAQQSREPVLLDRLIRLGPTPRLLFGVWALFFGLIALGIHGAPTPALAQHFGAGPVYGYVFEGLARLAEEHGFKSPTLDQALMMSPPAIRSDDFLTRFPMALSQLSHQPKFPVVNQNYWDGINMLVQPQYDMPVRHIAAVARPASWGYFFLHPRRAVAWEWWFPPFACFTVLYLLLLVVLGSGAWKLAAFASAWFCGSAALVCFGYWPAYVTFFAALAALCAYWLLRSESAKIQLLCGVLLGLASAGFAMILYPPWQPPLAYLFLFLIAGLVYRDRLHRSLTHQARWRWASLLIAGAIVTVIVAAYLAAGWPALKTMAATVYPGQRRLSGGGMRLWQVFTGAYNLITSFRGLDVRAANGARFHIDETEASSFYLFFPALIAPLALSKSWRQRFSPAAWLVGAYLIIVLYDASFGLPRWLEHLTLFDRTYPERLTPVIGLASIILCAEGLRVARLIQIPAPAKLRTVVIPLASALLVGGLFASAGIHLAASTGTPRARWIVVAAVAGALASYWMVKGKARAFCAVVALAVVPIPWLFNCLSTNLDYIYRSPAAQKIQELDSRESKPPLWICYDNYTGVLVTILGGKSVSGIQWPPDLEFWHALDPARQYESFYNRYVHVILHYTDQDSVSFTPPHGGVLEVKIRPDNPVLKQMGAKYILAPPRAAQQIDPARFPLVYRAPGGGFSIFEVP